MNNGSKNIWAWLQSNNRIYKVVSNPIKGTIEVYDEKGNLVMKRENLSKKAVEVIEKNFLEVTAKKLNETPTDDSGHSNFDPMIA